MLYFPFSDTTPTIAKGRKVGRSPSDWAVWPVEQSAKQIGTERFGAHDLRRARAKLCRKAGGDLARIQFLPGRRSADTAIDLHSRFNQRSHLYPSRI